MMIASMHVVWGGVCERFPRLRFAFLESGGGWMPSWLDRMDRHYEQEAFNADLELRMPPSEYFKRQCWISMEPTERTLSGVVDYLGANHVMWATDFPHLDGWYPGAPKMVADRLTAEQRAGVLGQSAIEYYKLDRPN
jgi:predicted TIM-barrel fold metal-dependent hydrolase